MIVRKGGAEILVLGKDKKGHYLQPFIRRKVVRNNENFIMIFTGRPRTGKSNSCIYLAESLRDNYGLNFDGEKHIAMGTLDFMKILNSRPKAGTVIIYEEAPVGHNSRNWHSKENAMLNGILNTFGFMRYVIIMNGVNFSDLDKQAQKLIHMKVECYRKDVRNRKIYGQPAWIKYVDEANKFFRTAPRDIHGAKIKTLIFSRCSKDAWKLYEKKKFAWNYKNLENMIKEARIMFAEGVNDNILSYEEILKRVMADPTKVITKGNGKISAIKLNAFFDIKPSLAKRYATKLNMEDIDYQSRANDITYKILKKPQKVEPIKDYSYINRLGEKLENNKGKTLYLNKEPQREGITWTPKVMKTLKENEKE